MAPPRCYRPGWPKWAYWQFTSRATVPGIRAAGCTDVGYGG
ncbi:MAG: hypothetical protein ABR922_04405 [Streptosporangiaceae bacterium]|jgi:GH25 family lysozyme M1 (1,4-beta-N-acetylmuramidase)